MSSNVTIDWLHVLILLGAVQGVLLALVLATQRRNRTANRLLALAMIAFSVYLATSVYHAAGLEQRVPHFFGAGYPMPLLFGPLVYLYAVTASDRTRRLRWTDALHFAPFAIVVIAALPIYLMSAPGKLAFHHALQRGEIPLLLRIVDPLKFVSGIVYTVATILLLRRHEARAKESYSTLERVNLRWLVRLALAAAAIWALATLFLMLDPVDHPLAARGDDVVALAVAILVYWIGYMALRQPEIFDWATVDRRPASPDPAADVRAWPSGGGDLFPRAGPRTSEIPAGETGVGASVAVAAPTPHSEVGASESAARYERSGLTDREAAALERALLALMDAERPWQDSELTLADLAERLDTTPHKLSEVMNSRLHQTFYDFVNAYRVRDVQRRIADEQSRHLKILALAMDAGFASKSTFNHVFRKHTGRTPSDYRKALTG